MNDPYDMPTISTVSSGGFFVCRMMGIFKNRKEKKYGVNIQKGKKG